MKYLLVLGTLCSLAVLSRVQAQCDKVIIVDVTNDGSLVLPCVNSINFTTDLKDASWMLNTTSVDNGVISGDDFSCGDSFVLSVTGGGEQYEVSFEFERDHVTCQSISLPRSIETGANNTIECVPVSSCDVDNSITSIMWRRVLVDDSVNVTTTNFTLPGGLTLTPIFYDIEDIVNAGLNISMADASAAGEYQAVDNNGTVLYTFILYHEPEIISVTANQQVIRGYNNAKGVVLYCVVRSFPYSTVTWTRDSTNINPSGNIEIFDITDENRKSHVNISNNITYTINGGIRIMEADYEDAGIYRCEATTLYGTASRETRLRVRSPLRPLWPALGIILTFILTAVFIVSGYLVDKIKEEKTRGTIEQEEFDAAFQRPQSVISYDDDKGMRRSSQRQLIPKT